MATMHIGGLSSGTDYAGMVEQMLAARSVTIEAKQTEMSELDYDMGAWSEVDSLTESLTESLDKLRGFELWNSMDAESSLESVATASAADASLEQQYTLSVTHLARAQSISSTQIDTTNDLIASGLAGEGDTFEIEGEAITIEAGETLTSLRTKINSAALNMAEGSRVQASLVNNHLVLTREDYGSGSITLSDTAGSVLQDLGVLDSAGDIVNENVTGRDAVFSVNGISVTRSSNSVLTDVVEGMTLNLEGVGTTTIEVKPDRDAAKDAILSFVEKYNALAELIDDYTQNDLSSSSELSMTGELYGDTLINTMKTGLRSQVTLQSAWLDDTNAAFNYNGQTGVMDTLADIGIWTSGESNRLELVDESRLDDMLDYEFENVTQLFRGVYDSATVSYQGGVGSDFYRYASGLGESLTGDIAQRIDALSGQYDELSEDVDELEDALTDYEQDLWDDFTAMEDALANMESQSQYITSMFSGS